MDTRKIHKKVYFETWTRDGYKGRWVYSQRHMRFSESDIAELYEKRPYKHEEKRAPEYLYRIDKYGIHIALFYDGMPVKKSP